MKSLILCILGALVVVSSGLAVGIALVTLLQMSPFWLQCVLFLLTISTVLGYYFWAIILPHDED